MREGGTKPTDARDAKPNARVSQLIAIAHGAHGATSCQHHVECSNLSFYVFMVGRDQCCYKKGFGKNRFAANI